MRRMIPQNQQQFLKKAVENIGFDGNDTEFGADVEVDGTLKVNDGFEMSGGGEFLGDCSFENKLYVEDADFGQLCQVSSSIVQIGEENEYEIIELLESANFKRFETSGIQAGDICSILFPSNAYVYMSKAERNDLVDYDFNTGSAGMIQFDQNGKTIDIARIGNMFFINYI